MYVYPHTVLYALYSLYGIMYCIMHTVYTIVCMIECVLCLVDHCTCCLYYGWRLSLVSASLCLTRKPPILSATYRRGTCQKLWMK